MAWRSRTRTYCPNCYERYAPGDRACGRCGRVRDQKTLAEMRAESEALQTHLRWLWPTLGVGALLFIALLLTKSQTIHKSSHMAAAPSLPAAERTQEAKQKADDAKFWAAKEKREAHEVAAYHVLHQVPPVSEEASASPAPMDVTGPNEGSTVLGAGVELHPVPHSPTGGGGDNSGAPSGQSNGARGVSAM